jgi:hypothetical protein
VGLSTVRTAVICVALATSPLSNAQAVKLTVKHKEIQHGTGIGLELLLDARSSSSPAGLQWEFALPPGLQIAEIEGGKAVKKAGKTLICKGAKCLIYGWNRTTIPNGQIAIAKTRVTQSLNDAPGSAPFGYPAQSRNRNGEVGIVNVVASSVDGKTIKVLSSSGAASVSKTP